MAPHRDPFTPPTAEPPPEDLPTVLRQTRWWLLFVSAMAMGALPFQALMLRVGTEGRAPLGVVVGSLFMVVLLAPAFAPMFEQAGRLRRLETDESAVTLFVAQYRLSMAVAAILFLLVAAMAGFAVYLTS